MSALTPPANRKAEKHQEPDCTRTLLRYVLPIVTVSVLIAGCSLFKSEEEEKYTAGQTYFSRNDYIEYTAGDLPIILSIPHGGTLVPDEIPDRQYGINTHHPNTQELGRAMAAALNSRLGGNVHLIINNLRRSKLDANQTILQGAENNEFAEQAWNEYHDFIEEARGKIKKTWSSGLYLDIHGHTHAIQRIELGYCVDSAHFSKVDLQLNDFEIRDKSSIRRLAKEAASNFVGLLRGPMSLGTLLENAGYPAIPSTQQPDPGMDPYMNGDWSVKQYGSRDILYGTRDRIADLTDAIQITANWDGVRATAANQVAFAQAFAGALEEFIETHYEFDLQGGPPQD